MGLDTLLLTRIEGGVIRINIGGEEQDGGKVKDWAEVATQPEEEQDAGDQGRCHGGHEHENDGDEVKEEA